LTRDEERLLPVTHLIVVLLEKLKNKLSLLNGWLKNNKKRSVALLVLLMVIAVGTYFLLHSSPAYGISTNWIQTDWSGGVSTTTYPSYPDDRTGWTNFYGKDHYINNATSISMSASSTLIKRSASLPQALEDACVVYEETTDKFYQFGGYWLDDSSNSHYSSTTVEYDPSSHAVSTSSIGNLPVQLRGHGCIRASSTAVYIFGGYDNTNSSFNDTVYKFDPSDSASDVVSTGVSLGQGRKDAAMAHATEVNKSYIFGGYYLDDSQDSHYLNEIVEFDPTTGATSSVATTASKIRGAVAVYHSQQEAIYLFGGADSSGNFNADIYKFDPSDYSFTDTGHDLGQGRQYIASAFYSDLQNKIYLFGGYYQDLLNNDTFSNKVVSFSTSSGVTERDNIFASGGLNKGAAAYSSQERAIFVFGGHNESDFSDAILSYPLAQRFTSNSFNMTDPGSSLSSIEWSENLPGNSNIKIQIRTANNNNNNTPGLRSDDTPDSFSNWCGPNDGDSATSTCSTSTYFTDPTGGETIDEMFTDDQNDQWIQYRVFYTRESITNEPSLDDITLNYEINSEPSLANVSGSQAATGEVNLTYDLSDQEQSSIESSLFYNGALLLNGSSTIHATSVDVTDPNNVLGLMTATTTYTLQIEKERLTCNSKNATNDTFSDCTRGANNTSFYQVNHASGTQVWIKANNVTGDGSVSATTSTTSESMTWDAKSDLAGFYSSSTSVLISGHDQSRGYGLGHAETSFELDTENPTSSIDALGDWQTTDSWTLSWSGGDAGVGLDTYDIQYRKNNNQWFNCATGTTATSLTFPDDCLKGRPTAEDEDVFAFRGRAVDQKGNQESYPGTAEVTTTVDLEAPEVSIATPEADAWQTSDFTVGIGDSDNSNMASCEYRVDDGNDGSYEIGWTSRDCSANLSLTVGVGETCSTQGENQCLLEIKGTDDAGLVTTDSRKFNIDYEAPSGGSISHTDGLSTSSALTIELDDGTDNGSGLDTATRELERKEADLSDGSCGSFGDWSLIAIGSGVDYSSHVDDNVGAPHCYRYRYSVADKAGHQVIYNSSATTSLDASQPQAMGGLRIDSVSTSSVGLSWSEVTTGYFDKYVVWYGQNKNDVLNRTGSAASTTVSDQATTRVTINNLTAQTFYYFKLWAHDTRGNANTTIGVKTETVARNYQQWEGIEVEGVQIE